MRIRCRGRASSAPSAPCSIFGADWDQHRAGGVFHSDRLLRAKRSATSLPGNSSRHSRSSLTDLFRCLSRTPPAPPLGASFHLLRSTVHHAHRSVGVDVLCGGSSFIASANSVARRLSSLQASSLFADPWYLWCNPHVLQHFAHSHESTGSQSRMPHACCICRPCSPRVYVALPRQLSPAGFVVEVACPGEFSILMNFSRSSAAAVINSEGTVVSFASQ